MKLILLLLVLCFTNVYSALVPKNLAGEPSEFKSFNLPSPLDVSQSSDSLLLPIVLVASETTNDIEWVGTVPVDSDNEFTLSLFSSFPLSEFNVVAIPPTTSSSISSFHGKQFIKTSTPTTQNGTFGIDGATTQSLSYTWTKPTVGDWTVKITASSLLKKDSRFLSTLSDDNTTPQLFVMAQNPSDTHIYSYISSYNNLFVGEKVSVLAMLHKTSEFLTKGERPLNWKPQAIKLVDASALIKLSLPDGTMETIEMFDDGLHDDLEAGDGLFGGYVSVAELGNYEAQVILKGVQGEKNIIRSNQHLIPITTQFLVLTGSVQSSQDGDANLNIYYIVESGNSTSISTATPAVRLYSEVYGTDKAGNKVAIAWVGGVTSATPLPSDTTQFALTAQLNARWIAKVGAVAPFFVKNVLVSDLSTFVPLSNTSSTSSVEMIGEYKDVNTIDHNPPLHVITKEMRDGKMPQHLAERFGKQTGNGKLILVHGYCASDDPFTFEDFENAVEFQDFKQNRPNDEFAQKIAELGEQFTDGYSLVVHSQGGNAALHLLTFYHSGLDLSQAFEGRVVQSMGTPYSGTALAGTWASIGKSVGVGCSSNNDLTVDGAALWLNSIPADKRSLIYYTTTQYGTGSLINSCNLAANAVLKWPNDGVVDQKHSGLEGGNNLDHIKGWCHTTGMNFDAQTQNHEYNKEMSAKSVW